MTADHNGTQWARFCPPTCEIAESAASKRLAGYVDPVKFRAITRWGDLDGGWLAGIEAFARGGLGRQGKHGRAEN